MKVQKTLALLVSVVLQFNVVSAQTEDAFGKNPYGYEKQQVFGLKSISPLHIDTKHVSYKDITFELMQGDTQTATSAEDIEELVREKGLKIVVNGKAFELMFRDQGSNDRAIVRSIQEDQCVIQVVSITMQRIFNIIVLMVGNDVVISDDVEEISSKEYRKQLLVEIGCGSLLEPEGSGQDKRSRSKMRVRWIVI